MLTAQENELLTRVGPGTPCGELFRRYWQPIALLPDLSETTPTRFVRILGEDLVLFRDRSGRMGLLGDHCSHRGASLLYGRVEERGIACAYHGWLYDIEGNSLETPPEPADSRFHLTVKQRAYPVRERYGMYWAYLGPLPVPIFPRYDVAEVGRVSSVRLVPQQDCNWLQVVENNLDQAHVFILHQSTAQRGVAESNSARGLIDQLSTFDYQEAPGGIRRTQLHRSGEVETDLMIFPSTQRIYNHFSVKVPIDDTHTAQFLVFVDISPDPASRGDLEVKAADQIIDCAIESSQEAKSPPEAMHPIARYRMDKLRFQDFTVLETQGAIAAREQEKLATSDRGVVLLRNLLKREIEKVQQGLDPIGVIREPARDLVDTFIQSHLDLIRSGFRRSGIGLERPQRQPPNVPEESLGDLPTPERVFR